MSSFIRGYEYDIFISYRRKDNLPSTGSYGRQGKGEVRISKLVQTC